MESQLFWAQATTPSGGIEDDYVEIGGGAGLDMAGAGDDIVIVNGTVLSTDKNPIDDRSNYVLIDTGTGGDVVEITTILPVGSVSIRWW